MLKTLMVIFSLTLAACATPMPAQPTALPVPQPSVPPTLAARLPPRQNPPAPQPPQANRGSDATQTMQFDIPAHPLDVVLGRPTQHSVMASVLPYQDSEAYIEFGTQRGLHPSKLPPRPLAAGQPVEMPLDSLSPDTLYYYQLFYRTGSSGIFTAVEEKSFRTQRAPGSTFTFDIQADSHLDSNSNPEVYARTLANERADQPDFIIDLGDTFMTDKYQPYTAAQRQYLMQRYFFGLVSPSAPLFLVLGNHDGEQGSRLTGTANSMPVWSAKLRTQYFPNPIPNDFYTGNSTPDKFVGPLENYYAWEWGDALFAVLDPFWFTPPRGNGDNWNWTLGAEQYQWLKRTLETNHAKYKFVFIHHLVGGIDDQARGGVEAATQYEWGGNNADGRYGFAAKRPGWAMPIHQLLVQNKVSAVFHGHDHLFVKQNLDGIVYQEVPQPSSEHFDATNSARVYGYVNGDVLGSPGHLRVTITPGQATVDYVRSYLQQDETAQRRNGASDYTYTIKAR